MGQGSERLCNGTLPRLRARHPHYAGQSTHIVARPLDSRSQPDHKLPFLLDRMQVFDIVHLAFTAFPADVRVKREASAAAATGRAVAVVCYRERDQPAEEAIGPLSVVRLPGTKTRRGPLRYLLEYLSFVRRCRRLLATDARFQQVRVVHVHTLPDFLVWAATPARRRGARIILDLHEIFPEFALAKYPGPLGRLASGIARALERQARRRADVVVT